MTTLALPIDPTPSGQIPVGAGLLLSEALARSHQRVPR
jgi:hypothetical protein